MKYLRIPPPDILKDYVRYFWVLEGEASEAEPYVHRTMADVGAELVFHYKGSFEEIDSRGAKQVSLLSEISAQSRKVRRFVSTSSFGILGVYFYPYALTHLFKVPAQELLDQQIDLESFLGKSGRDLATQIFSLSNNTQKINTLSKYLTSLWLIQTTPLSGIQISIQRLMHDDKPTRIGELADFANLSLRQFERNFKGSTGFSPITFSRIHRFQNSLKHYSKAKQSLTEIAYSLGYYDQSHFIKDFKEFSGHNPKEFFSGKAESMEWRSA